MFEILYRAQKFTREGLPNISKADQAAIATNKKDTFDFYIRTFAKHKLLDGMGGGIYDELHKLRKYRNKIHIQKDAKVANASRDEDKLFSDAVTNWSVSTARKTIEFLSKTYPRPKGIEGHVQPIKLPVT